MSRTVSLVVAAGSLIALAGCSSKNVVDTSVTNSLGFQYGHGAAVVYEPGHRYAASSVSGTTLTGRQLSLESLRGRVVVVNFWASNCGPCLAETQAFNQVARDDAARGVSFVGIDERDDIANARHYELTHHVPYPSLVDSSGGFTLQFPHATPDTTPATLVLDRHGNIAARVNGALDYTHLRRLVDTILSQQT